MNPLNYSLAEMQKAVVQLITFLVLLATFFIVFDPALGPALIAVAVAVFGVIAVFSSPNVSESDATKAVQSLAASIIGVVGLFGTVPTTTGEKIASLVALAIPPILVFIRANQKKDPPAPEPAPEPVAETSYQDPKGYEKTA